MDTYETTGWAEDEEGNEYEVDVEVEYNAEAIEDSYGIHIHGATYTNHLGEVLIYEYSDYTEDKWESSIVEGLLEEPIYDEYGGSL
tara:strand:+ start:319 stop:576 length:258 start_codon:yes stop_codon:yes gene_type:complete